MAIARLAARALAAAAHQRRHRGASVRIGRIGSSLCASSSSSASSTSSSSSPSSSAPFRESLGRLGVGGDDAESLIGDAGDAETVNVSLNVDGRIAESLADHLMFEDAALAVTMQDARRGTVDETEVYSMGGEKSFFCRPSASPSAAAAGSEASASPPELWNEVALRITIDAAALRSDGDDEVEREVASMLRDAFDELAVSGEAGVAAGAAIPEFTLSFSSSLDWIRRVEESYRPILISCDGGGDMWLVPHHRIDEHARRQRGAASIDVVLAPGLAFGTGEHPTTRLCLEWIMRNVAPSPSLKILDIGTGSGVLGIAACKVSDAQLPAGCPGGAARAECLDIDPLAVKACAANAEHNGLSHRMDVYQCDEDCHRVLDDGGGAAHVDGDQRDLVLANILAPTLIALERYIAGRCREGGRVCLSGLLEGQAGDVVRAYSAEHFDDVHIVRDRPRGGGEREHDWVVVTGVRNSRRTGGDRAAV